MTRYHHGVLILETKNGTTAIVKTVPSSAGITSAVLILALVAGSSGLLFGYDLGITGGVVANQDFLEMFFPSVAEASEKEGTDQQLSDQFCEFTNPSIQLFTSSLFLAGAFSAALAGWLTSKYGRRCIMMAGGLFFCSGTVLVASSSSLPVLITGRIILGFGVGFANQATPLYLSEMAPPQMRGALNILFQLATTVGILYAQIINYWTQNIPGYGWRVSLGLGGVPGLILSMGALFLPDTPHSLIARGRPEHARAVLDRIRGNNTDEADVEMSEICKSFDSSKVHDNPYRTILQRKYRPQLIISVLIPVFQQLTGINAIMFYAPQVFEASGQSGSSSLFSTVTIGVVNVLSTFVALVVVDRLGRKFLFVQGGIQMMICEIVTGVLLEHHFSQPNDQSLAKAIVAFVCLFVAGFAWSWGPLAWLVPSEIHPTETRAAGTAIATFCNFITTFIIGQSFLSMLCVMEFGVFFFFAGWMVIMTAFVVVFLPETKGIQAEQVHRFILEHHWFWRRYFDPDDVVGDAEDIGSEIEML